VPLHRLELLSLLRLYEPSFALSGVGKDPPQKLRHRRELWTFANYGATVLGVVGKNIILSLQRSHELAFSWAVLLSSLVVAAVVLPTIYQKSRLARQAPHAIHLFVSFQNGFFWQTLIEQLPRMM